MIYEVEIKGKSGSDGSFSDGKIIGMEPQRIERTVNCDYWTYYYRNVKEDAIVVKWGKDSRIWLTVRKANGERCSYFHKEAIIEIQKIIEMLLKNNA